MHGKITPCDCIDKKKNVNRFWNDMGEGRGEVATSEMDFIEMYAVASKRIPAMRVDHSALLVCVALHSF